MDSEKTGKLIAQARHEKGMTQKELAAVLFVLVFAFFAFGAADAVFTDKIQKTVTADIYVEGVSVGETAVKLDGTWGRFPGAAPSYKGRFAVAAVEKTCREGAEVFIRMNEKGRADSVVTLYYAGDFDTTTFRRSCYAGRSMESFAVMTADGTIIATSDALARLLSLPDFYPLAD